MNKQVARTPSTAGKLQESGHLKADKLPEVFTHAARTWSCACQGLRVEDFLAYLFEDEDMFLNLQNPK